MKKLSAFQIAIALATTHYGLGFLVGTGQDIAAHGAAGMLYAFSTALGLLTLIPITQYYWGSKKPIWDIFLARHGKTAGKITAFLSSFWMLGVVASQILGGSAALMALGLSRTISTICIAAILLVLSYVDLGRLSKIFFYFLLFSSAVVVFTLFQYGVVSALTTPWLFLSEIPRLSTEKLFGTLLTTVLITFIGMDFHQFIVSAQNESSARWGAFGGFLILFILTTVLGSAILGFLRTSNDLSGSQLTNAQVVPQMLIQTGESFFGNLGRLLFLIPIVLVSIGSGSAVTKVVLHASQEFLPSLSRKKVLNLVIVLICVGLTLLSESVVGLVVSFYATYVGAVLVPFIVNILEERGYLRISDDVFTRAILSGFGLSVFLFLISKAEWLTIGDISVYMLVAGLLGASAIFIISSMCQHILHKKIR